MFSSDATRLVIANAVGGVMVPFSFDPNPADTSTYMQVTKLYGSSFSINSESSAFSKITPNLWYTLQNSSAVTGLVGTHGVSANEFVLMSYDFTSASTAPTIANGGINLIVDFNSCLTGLPAFGITGVLSVSDDDQTFTSILNGSLGQDSYGFVPVYNRTLGCAMWNTLTGTVTKFGGGTGTIVNANSLTGIDWPVEFYTHEVQIFHDGGKVFMQGASGGCIPGNNCDGDNNGAGGTNYVWETGVPYTGHASPTGLNVYPQQSWSSGTIIDGTYYGHSMQGYGLWMSAVAVGDNNTAAYFLHAYNSLPGTAVQITPPRNPSGTTNCYDYLGNPWYCPNFDQHTSWANNTNSADNAPFLTITYEGEGTSATNHLVPDTPQFQYGDEVDLQPTACYPACVNNNPWRLTHTFSTPEQTHAATFDDYIGIGAVSPVAVYGQYFTTFTSNWEGQLGCPDGTFATGPWGASCPANSHGLGATVAPIRADVFIASIPIAVATVSLAPSAVNCGNQALGVTSSPQPVTLANSETPPLTGISVSITGTSESDFAQTNDCGTQLIGNSSCAINVTFTPSVYGSESATLSVTDSAGTQTSSLTGTGTDVTAPTTQITAPANNATVSGTVTVTATASDTVGVTSVQIYIDGVLSASGTSSPLNYSWDTASISNGTHTIYSKAYDAAGNVGTSTTISVTVNNSSTQLIQNPGFETGNLAHWSASGAYLPFVTVGHAHTGTYSAQLGASMPPEPISDSALYQTVTIPSTATSASLDYYYFAGTTDTIAHDWQEAQIQDNSGNKLAQVMKICRNTLSWKHVDFNLIAYKGQTIRIYFNTHQNGNGKLTYMYLDDVSVTVK